MFMKKALILELSKHGLKCQQQQKMVVNYKGEIVGEYCADIIVEDKILLELKAINRTTSAHEAQLLNYLKATGIKLGLLINFTYPKATVKRYIL